MMVCNIQNHWVYGIRPPSGAEMSTKSRNVSGGVERGRYIRLTSSPSFMSQLSRECGILNVSETYRLPRPITGITLLAH
jgi:hypothetical protein